MIEVVKNPIDNSEVTIVDGIVAKLNIYPAPAGNKFGNTHTAQFIMDSGEKINIQGYKSTVDSLTIQENKKWFEVKEGMSVRFPVDVNVKGSVTYYNVQRAKIKVTDKQIKTIENNAANAPRNASNTQGNTNPKVNQENAKEAVKESKTQVKPLYKIYGEVKSVNNNIVEVFNEDSKTVSVILNEQQLADPKFSVGGRIAGFVDDSLQEPYENITGFKAYVAKKAKDDLSIRVGNAMNIAVALCKNKENNSIDLDEALILVPHIVKEVDDLRDKIANEYKDMDEYSRNARLGQVCVLAAEGKASDASLIPTAYYLFKKMGEIEDNIRKGGIVESKSSTEKQEIKVDVNSTSEEPKVITEEQVNINSNNNIYDDYDLGIPF